MSTFPEYLMCKKLGISPIIISCLTNYGAGLVKKEVLHEDVSNCVKAHWSNVEVWEAVEEHLRSQKKTKY